MTQELKDLLAKVEGGGHVATKYFEAVWKTGFGWGYNACNEGSLDAARDLHKAVLGDRYECDLQFRPNGLSCAIVFLSETPLAGSVGFSELTAKAWLIAIIKLEISKKGEA